MEEISYTEENNRFFCISYYWCPFRKTKEGWRGFFIPKKIIFLISSYWCPFRRRGGWSYWCPFRRRGGWRKFLYTEENNRFLYPVTGVLFETKEGGVTGVLFEYVEGGGLFIPEVNNLFLHPVTGVLFEEVELLVSFRKRGSFIPKKIKFFHPVTGVFFENEEVGDFYNEENNLLSDFSFESSY
ncbi:hypothetical protein CEXT_231001 [Caerostris extrusa]|uniref:Uncharacterized protein n=1 Tax=Caerostris extrusa TaxID=172846 RepID=A0AAV4VQ81_CAEEX|nr:hypothetical protein CEXT_231001 [Caerostris extrusa]